MRRFEQSEEQGVAYKTGELAENRRFFDKQSCLQNRQLFCVVNKNSHREALLPMAVSKTVNPSSAHAPL